MTEQEITDEISRCVQAGDDYELDSFIASLAEEDRLTYRIALAAAYYEIYSIWFYDYLCGKVEMSGAESFFGALFEMLAKAESLDPEVCYHEDRGRTYEALADELTDVQAKQLKLIAAIEAYNDALRTGSPEVHAFVARVLLNKALLAQEFTDNNLEAITQRLGLALAQYTEIAVETSLHVVSVLGNASFTEKERWYTVLQNEVTNLLTALAKREPMVYLTWADTLVRVLDREEEEAPATEQSRAIAQQANALLDNITDFATDDTEQLNRLGQAFAKAALRVGDNAEQQMHYYRAAFRHFVKGHAHNPAAWTFPVYATNALMAMARLYEQMGDHTNVIQSFEAGKILFAGVVDSDDDFTLNIYWAEFLFEYARRAYSFNAPSILREAEQKALLAKTLGKEIYDHPYLALAKIKLKLGDVESCLNILKECREVFTTPYSTYSWEQITEDEDFREIWPLLP